MLDDLKSAWRRLRHAPGFAVAAVLTLAIAVGANTAILSVADAVLFRPLPYRDADRVFVIQMRDKQTGSQYTRIDFLDLQTIDERHGGLGRTEMIGTSLGGAVPSVIVQTPEGAMRVQAAAVTPGYFGLLGVSAARGRLFTEDDAATAAGRAAVLSHASWRQRFAGDESIVGRAITVGTATFDVVGVLPPGFVFPAGAFFSGNPEIVIVQPKPASGATGGTFHPIVRLETGITREQAQAELDTIGAELARHDPKRGQAVPYLNEVRSMLYPAGRTVMQFMLAAAALVLLLGCANLANMLMARNRSRERETAVRTALGAARLRVVRPVVFEALLIGLAGSALAVATTYFTFDALVEQVPSFVYGNAPVGVDLRVIAIGLMLGLVAAVIFAAIPAWRALRLDAQAIIQNRHRHGVTAQRAGRPMVLVQVALATMLVFGAVISARAFLSVAGLPLGFDPDRVFTLSLVAPKAAGDPQQFFARLIDDLRQRGDVISAGAAGSVPFDNSAYDEGIRVPGAQTVVAGIVHVLPGFFETASIPLVRGRLPTVDDLTGQPTAAVLSQSAATALFPDREALGQAFDNGSGRMMTVIGIVADVRKSIGERQDTSAAYVFPGSAARRMTLVVKARARQESTLVEIRRMIASGAPGAAINASWWTDRIGNATAIRNPRFQTMVLSSFAGMALVLMAVGVFAVIAFGVAARTREMGIRVAIGANPTSLVRLMVRQALVPVGLGLTIGLLATRWLAQFAESQLYQVETNDPATLAGAAVTVLAAAIAAAYVPAWRASRVDPVLVLRTE